MLSADPALAAQIAKSVEDAGLPCRHVVPGRPARCQVVVLDTDGRESELESLMAGFRASNAQALVVAIGTEPDKTLLLRLLRSGAYDFVEKPLDTESFVSDLRSIYERSLISRMSAEVSSRLKSSESVMERHQQALHREIVRSNEELQSVNHRLHKVVSQLKTLYHMGRDLADNENWSDALDRFLMALVNFMEAEGAALLLFSEDEQALRARSTFQVGAEDLDAACRRIIEGWESHPRAQEIHPLEGYGESVPAPCLERSQPWQFTVIPLRHRSRPVGFLLLEKHYTDGFDFKWDYDFLNTLQTIFVEEIANANYISELRRLGRFNNKILDNIRSGVITTDAEGTIRYHNVWAEDMCPRLLERTRKDAPTIRFDSMFEARQFPDHFFDQVMASAHDSHVLEVACHAGAREPFPARLRTTKMFDDNLNTTVLVAIFEDLTEQKRMEAEIRRNDRLRVLGQLSAGMAHEIRNPLTGIANCAEMLDSHLGEDSEKRKYTRAMLDEIHRLDGIVRNLLKFARPARPQLAQCDVSDVVARVDALLSEKASERGVRLDTGSIDEDLRCWADSGQLTQVLLNLVLNAIQSCEDGGQVKVVARGDERDDGAASIARIDVIDDGPGVPADIRESLFEPFVTTKAQGTGLGLAISRQIIEEHEGAILCKPWERGACFSIELPLYASDTNRAKGSVRHDRGEH